VGPLFRLHGTVLLLLLAEQGDFGEGVDGLVERGAVGEPCGDDMLGSGIRGLSLIKSVVSALVLAEYDGNVL